MHTISITQYLTSNAHFRDFDEISKHECHEPGSPAIENMKKAGVKNGTNLTGCKEVEKGKFENLGSQEVDSEVDDIKTKDIAKYLGMIDVVPKDYEQRYIL